MTTNSNVRNEIEEELKISILLENFIYSGTKNNIAGNESAPNFFGRTKEKARLLDHLKKVRGGSFLVAGYRGVGKTRFVDEVLREYKKEKKDGILEIKINLGNDGDLSSKSVLFNMVSLLSNELSKRFALYIFIDNVIKKLLLVFVLSSLFFASILSLSGLDKKLSESSHIGAIDFINLINLSIYWVVLILFFVIWALVRDGKISFLTWWNAFVGLKTLRKEIYSTIDNHLQVKSGFFDYGKKIVVSPLTTNQIEARLNKILEKLETKEVIFIFDELDKLSGRAPDKKEADLDLIKESKFRKQQVDSILGDLKKPDHRFSGTVHIYCRQGYV